MLTFLVFLILLFLVGKAVLGTIVSGIGAVLGLIIIGIILIKQKRN